MELHARGISIWRGLTSLFLAVLVIACFLASVLQTYKGSINEALGVTGPSYSDGGGSTYFESEFGELNEESLQKFLEAKEAFVVQEMEEGAVLLKNDGTLPFGEQIRSVSLFGENAANYSGYFAEGYTVFVSEGGDLPPADAAVVILSRHSSEGTDLQKTDELGNRTLALSDSEEQLLASVSASGRYKSTVVLLESAAAMEVEWLDEYNIGACLWIGPAEGEGKEGIVNLLSGEANPSGRLTDTYAANSLSSPAAQNFGENTFVNADDYGLDNFQKNFTIYQEGIYVGYKYYETRYEDCILGRGNAGGDAGTFASEGEGWDYADEVSYPFGYGLSYTEFRQEIVADSFSYDEEADAFNLTVRVENVGDRAGKEVVQLYVQQPYAEGGIEKASVLLAAFAKTPELKSGESAQVTLSIERYLLASYDFMDRQAYLLESGDYYFAIGTDAHDALNNILAAKGAAGMYDVNGEAVSGDAEKAVKYSLSDDAVYKESVYTGEEVGNLFSEADINQFLAEGDKIVYLSRSDWQNTWSDKITLRMNDAMYAATKYISYTPSGTKGLDECVYEQEGDLKLVQLIGVPLDDARWDELVRQMSIADLCKLSDENYKSEAVSSVGKPSTSCKDGPEQISGNYRFGDTPITSFASPIVMAATWNSDIFHEKGSLYGEDCLFAGVATAYAPGINVHRTQFCGRNGMYYSEDGIFNYYVGMNEMQGLREKGVVATIKHFAMNDQEFSRQGLATFAQEQCMREIYFRAFEGAMTKGNAVGVMTAYNRIGFVYASSNKALMEDLARGEWGYEGYYVTDYVQACSYAPTEPMLLNGVNAFGSGARATDLQRSILHNDDGVLLEKLQESTKHVLYAYANSLVMNGISVDTQIADGFLAWWEIVVVVILVVLSVGFIGSAAVYIYKKYVQNGGQKK